MLNTLPENTPREGNYFEMSVQIPVSNCMRNSTRNHTNCIFYNCLRAISLCILKAVDY